MESTPCWACGKEISSADKFCRECGKGQGRHVPWYYRHWAIILLTVLALGPFSLVLVWRSPVLSEKSKWIYTAAIGLFTWYLCLKTYQAWVLVHSIAGAMLQL